MHAFCVCLKVFEEQLVLSLDDDDDEEEYSSSLSGNSLLFSSLRPLLQVFSDDLFTGPTFWPSNHNFLFSVLILRQ